MTSRYDRTGYNHHSAVTSGAVTGAIELTDAIVARAMPAPGKSEDFVRDAKQPGLAVRVRKGGGKSFVYLATRPGQKGTFRVTIGSCRKFTVAAARKQAAILAGQRAQGADLVAARQQIKKVAKAAVKQAARSKAATLGALIAEDGPYEKSLRARAVVATPTALSALRRNLLPEHKNTDLHDLTRLDVTGAMDSLRAAGKQGAFGLLVRICLLGGPRRSEPTRIEWGKHVLPDRLTFDAHWTKMGLHHDIPRTALVDQVLDDARRFQRATSDLVFPSSKTGGRISGFNRLVTRLVKEAKTDKWTLHDLRRTLRTIMSRCGYDNDVQRLCVGQKPRGIDSVYNKDEQWTIRKMAFEAAHAYIAALIEGQQTDNVVRLQRANNPRNKLKAELLDRLREHHASGE